MTRTTNAGIPMSAEQEQARNIVRHWFNDGDTSQEFPLTTDHLELVALIRAALITTDFTARREEKESCARRVEALMGQESGNWNRAIVYAVAAIRQWEG